MSIAQPDSRAAARQAEVVALQAADVACDAYRETLDEPLRAAVRPDRVIAVVRGGLGDALASAVADLGSTAFAAARAAHIAAEVGSEEDARRAGAVAETAAEAARTGAGALATHLHDGDDTAHLVTLAHSAAMTAHLAADALEAYGLVTAPASLLSLHDRPAVPFPQSWRSRIEELSERLTRVRRGVDAGAAESDLLLAAGAASSAANHALRVYQRSGHGTGVSRAMSRVTRIAALAACYAGTSALDAA